MDDKLLQTERSMAFSAEQDWKALLSIVSRVTGRRIFINLLQLPKQYEGIVFKEVADKSTDSKLVLLLNQKQLADIQI